MKKKIIYGVCMLGLLALVATSCKKKEETTSSFLSEEITMEEDDMRYYYDPMNNKFVWENGDYIKVYNADNNQSDKFTVTATSGSSFTMTGPNIGSVQNMYAFYPYEMAETQFDVEDLRQEFKVGNHNDVNEGTFNNVFQAKKVNGRYTICDGMFPKAAKKNANGVFTFRNFFGMARLHIQGVQNPDANAEHQFAKIVKLRIEDNQYKLWGTVSLRPFELGNNGEAKLKAMMEAYIENGVAFANHSNYSWVMNELGYCVGTGGGNTLELCFDNTGYPTLPEESSLVCIFGVRPGGLAKGFHLYAELDNGQEVECIHQVGTPDYANPNLNDKIERNIVAQNGKIKDYFFDIQNIDWSLYE